MQMKNQDLYTTTLRDALWKNKLFALYAKLAVWKKTIKSKNESKTPADNANSDSIPTKK